ncbi:hypothetical protein ABG768_007481 [Culter alburnus]
MPDPLGRRAVKTGPGDLQAPSPRTRAFKSHPPPTPGCPAHVIKHQFAEDWGCSSTRREQGSEQLPMSLLLYTAFIIPINLVLQSPIKWQPVSVWHSEHPVERERSRRKERRRTMGAVNLTNGKLHLCKSPADSMTAFTAATDE